jgi:hypothetical protein
MTNLKTTLGGVLLPIVNRVALAFSGLLTKNMPKIEAFIGGMKDWAQGVVRTFDDIKFAIGPAWEALKQIFAGDNISVAPLINLMAALGMNVDKAREWGVILGEVAKGFGQLINGDALTVFESWGVPDVVLERIERLRDLISNIGGIFKDAMDDIASGKSFSEIWEDTAASVSPSGGFVDSQPGLKSRLKALGNQILDAIGEGLKDVVIITTALLNAVAEWINSAGVQEAAADFGVKVGEFIVNAIKSALGSDENSKIVSEGLVIGLAKAILNVADAVYGLFWQFGIGIGAAIVAGINGTPELTDVYKGIAQKKLDEMPSNEGDYWNKLVGGDNKTKGGIPRFANGFNGMVNRPTLFLAGEAGPEHVSVTPQGKGAQGIVVNVYSPNPTMAGNSVVAALKARGAF